MINGTGNHDNKLSHFCVSLHEHQESDGKKKSLNWPIFPSINPTSSGHLTMKINGWRKALKVFYNNFKARPKTPSSPVYSLAGWCVRGVMVAH
ncbi:CLUMA_CG016865, isoform A [Clunio marinus]|uniref:CLUMA_CG016865, isoform A n=1 Tax=Clunio marinus TaxID=568069 RepID=A0A1J1ISP6_9DIPT|nr:CLUMA_CG016865, isoform A [Clunio marinus]